MKDSKTIDPRPGPRVHCPHCGDTHHVDQKVCDAEPRTSNPLDELLRQLRKWREMKMSGHTTMEQIWDQESYLRQALDEYDKARPAVETTPPRSKYGRGPPCPKCSSDDTSALSFDVMECAACGHEFPRPAVNGEGSHGR